MTRSTPGFRQDLGRSHGTTILSDWRGVEHR